jgi:hypothetical protein
MLSVWNIAALPLFFSSRIDYGTEVISLPKSLKPVRSIHEPPLPQADSSFAGAPARTGKPAG